MKRHSPARVCAAALLRSIYSIGARGEAALCAAPIHYPCASWPFLGCEGGDEAQAGGDLGPGGRWFLEAVMSVFITRCERLFSDR
jgi:hypothetical protein